MSFLHSLMLKKLGVVQTHPVSIQRDVKVRMPDGAELLTDVYLGNRGERAPVILIRSPYGKSASLAAGLAYPFAARGYNVVMQCCRGTFGSGGLFDPHHDEQRDGLSTVEWIKTQSWYGNAIGTFGLSYLGYTQWAIAGPAGPEVKAMAMQVTMGDFSRMTYAGDSMMLQNALSWTNMVTIMKRGGLGMLRIVWSQIAKRPIIAHQRWNTLPLAAMDQKIIGERVKFWRDWTQHASSGDLWWAPMSHRSAIPQIRRPITMVAGWHDIFLPWQLQEFAALRAAHCEARITIGPWIHTDTGVGQTGMHDALEWFAHHLRDQPLTTTRKAVKLFVIGAEEWREFDTWPPHESRLVRWHLQPQRGLDQRPPTESAPDEYRYDPRDPTPSVGGPALDGTPCSVDNAALEARPDVLSYTSAPLTQACEVIGPIHAELYATSSARSADFFVRLCDVDANGVSKNICDGLQRVRIHPIDRPQLVRVDLWPTAYRFAAGHRIRVQVSSGAFPRWARNTGTDEPIGTATELHDATQSIHHSVAYPSAIVLPHYGVPG